MSTGLSRSGVMLSAYAYAALTASCVPVICISVIYSIALPFDMAARDGTGVMEGIFVGALVLVMGSVTGLIVGLLTTLFCAFPGWLTCVLMAELSGIKHRVYYVVASVPTVLLAWFIHPSSMTKDLYNVSMDNLMAPSVLAPFVLIVTSLIGGLIGAHFYWKRAGQFALPNLANWKCAV